MNLLNTVTMLAGFGDWAQKVGSDLLDLIIGLTIGPLLWGLCDIFFIILNLFESMFRAVAGVGQVGAEGGEDIVLYLIQSRVVLEVFVSVLVLSLFLLVIFTIFAIVKNIYAEKQEPVSKIISASFKGLLMYLLVPVATIVCLMVGNIVLQAIDGATRPSTDTSASDMLFITACYNANKLRDSDLGVAQIQLQQMIANKSITKIEDKMASIGITDIDSAGMAERWQLDMIADWVDEGFVSDEGLSAVPNWATGNKWSYFNVKQYYHSMQISYLIVWVGGAFLIWAIGKITWGLVARMFKMTLYFAISPAVMATFPLDNGKALGAWRSEMVKNGTMAFVAVGLLNVLYTILPFINSSSIFDGFASGIAGLILSLFINIIAFSSVKDLIASISGWFGTGDALAEGVKAKGQYAAAKKKLSGVALKGVGMFAGIRGGMDVAKKNGENQFMGALKGLYGTTDMYKSQKEFSDAYTKGVSGAKETRKNLATNFGMNKDATTLFEAREAVEKERERIQAKIDQMNVVRGEQLSHATTDDERKEINKKWNDAIEKQWQSASFLEPLYETRQLDLDSRQKTAEKRQSNFAAFDTYDKTKQADQDLMKRILDSSGATGASRVALEAEWENIKAGRFGGITNKGHRNAIQESYKLFAADIASNEQEKVRALQQITNMANSSTSSMKYVMSVLGDASNANSAFSKMFNVTERDADGNVLKVERKDNVDEELILQAVQREQRGLTDEMAKLAKEVKDLARDKGNDFNKAFSTAELMSIGRSLDKK